MASLPYGENVSACTVEDPGSIPGYGRFPWRREWLPTPVFLTGEFHEQRSLAGYIVHGVSKSQIGLSTHTHTYTGLHSS